jgi:uncharacterized phage protein (TIGR01671 family)
MRDIKFRQFINERMVPFGFFPERHGGFSFTCAQNNRIDKYPVMQFTGLQDKNGVCIYEGDIIRDHVGIGSVQYMNKYATFRVKYSNPVGRGKLFLDYNIKGERESIEVIGNIYENLEVLHEN